eukprot:3661819-Pyramimonas_sp.AAC.1
MRDAVWNQSVDALRVKHPLVKLSAAWVGSGSDSASTGLGLEMLVAFAARPFYIKEQVAIRHADPSATRTSGRLSSSRAHSSGPIQACREVAF